MLLYYRLTWHWGSWIINQSCVSVCLANSSSFHVINFPCWLLDQQTHCSVHILLEHHHKIIHLALCTDDSTYQVKHSIVKFCGPKSVLYDGKTLDVLLFCLFFFIFIFCLPSGSYSCLMEPCFFVSNVHICFWLFACFPPSFFLHFIIRNLNFTHWPRFYFSLLPS